MAHINWQLTVKNGQKKLSVTTNLCSTCRFIRVFVSFWSVITHLNIYSNKFQPRCDMVVVKKESSPLDFVWCSRVLPKKCERTIANKTKYQRDRSIVAIQVQGWTRRGSRQRHFVSIYCCALNKRFHRLNSCKIWHHLSKDLNKHIFFPE